VALAKLKSRDWLARMPAGDPEVAGVGLQRAESPSEQHSTKRAYPAHLDFRRLSPELRPWTS
jgi:hypothetical protein